MKAQRAHNDRERYNSRGEKDDDNDDDADNDDEEAEEENGDEEREESEGNSEDGAVITPAQGRKLCYWRVVV
jgi:hypothetical protein